MLHRTGNHYWVNVAQCTKHLMSTIEIDNVLSFLAYTGFSRSQQSLRHSLQHLMCVRQRTERRTRNNSPDASRLKWMRSSPPNHVTKIPANICIHSRCVCMSMHACMCACAIVCTYIRMCVQTYVSTSVVCSVSSSPFP